MNEPRAIAKYKVRRVREKAFPIFIGIIVLLKLVLMAICTSDYQIKLFHPFVSLFVGGESDPYAFYYDHQLAQAFPYPPLMLLIESAGALLGRWFGMEDFLFKLPSLLFDCMGLFYLCKLCKNRRKYVAIFYFASPILLYATYMHGQLDIIPTSLLIAAIYYLTLPGNQSFVLASMFLGCALSTKLHILAILPLWFLFVLKKSGFLRAVASIGLPLLLLTAVSWPFWSEGFFRTVLLNKEQGMLTNVYINYGSLQLYLPVLLVLITYFNAFKLSHINRDLFVGLCGILFSIFLVAVPPMPGWYVWIVPFVAYFFVRAQQDKYISVIFYVILNALYLLFFLFFHPSDYVDLYLLGKDMSFMKFGAAVPQSFSFTLLTGFLIAVIMSMYRAGVASNSLYRRRNASFAIGIAGDSGCGKSTILNLLKDLFLPRNLLILEGDGDHKWERGDEMWDRITHLNPRANSLYRQARDVEILLAGNRVQRKEYDHDTGRFIAAPPVNPKRYTIICGLHALYLPQMRRQLDLKIYLDTDEALRRFWKIQRDVAQRGYTKQRILEQIEERMPDCRQYIYPQKEFADMVITYYDKNLQDCLVEHHDVVLSLRCKLSASVDLDGVLYHLTAAGICLTHELSKDLRHQTVTVDGDSVKEHSALYNDIVSEVIPQIDELIDQPVRWRSGIDGFVEFLILLVASYGMRGELTQS